MGTDHTLGAEGNTLCSEIHKLIISIWNLEELSLLYLFIKRMIKMPIVIIEGYQCYHLHTKHLIT